jgi:hypothetical protein
MRIATPDLVTNSYFPALAAEELGVFREEGLDADHMPRREAIQVDLMAPALAVLITA